MDLRLSLWLDINTWLSRNRTGVFGSKSTFSWWDKCKDQIPVASEVEHYTGELLVKVTGLFSEDEAAVTELGRFVEKCTAIVNNRDASPNERVLSAEAKEVLEFMVEVSRPFDKTAHS